jgi:hypothetical protein
MLEYFFMGFRLRGQPDEYGIIRVYHTKTPTPSTTPTTTSTTTLITDYCTADYCTKKNIKKKKEKKRSLLCTLMIK